MKSLQADTAKSKAVCSLSGFVLCSLLDFSAARAIKMQNAVMYAVRYGTFLFFVLIVNLLSIPSTGTGTYYNKEKLKLYLTCTLFITIFSVS